MNLRQRIRTAGVGSDSQANELGRILINACVKANLTLMEFVERVMGQKEHDNRKFAEAATTGEERFNLVMRNLSVDLAAAVTEIGAADLENFDAIPIKYRRSLFEGDDGNNFAKFEEFVNNKVAEIRAAITLVPANQAVDYMRDDCDVVLMSRVDASASTVTVSIPKSVSTSVIPVAAGGAGAVADVPVAVVPTKTPAEILHEKLLVQSSFYKALQIAKSQTAIQDLKDKFTLLQEFTARVYCLDQNLDEKAVIAKDGYAMIIADQVTKIAENNPDYDKTFSILKPFFMKIMSGNFKIVEAYKYQLAIRDKVSSGALTVKMVQVFDGIFGADRYSAKQMRARYLTDMGAHKLKTYLMPEVDHETCVRESLDSKMEEVSEYGIWSARMVKIAKGFAGVFAPSGLPLLAVSESNSLQLDADALLQRALNAVLREYPSVVADRGTKVLSSDDVSSSPTVFLARTEASDNLGFERVWGGKST